MEPSSFRVRPYSAKSILILMMTAGFRNVLAHCNNVFSFVCEVSKRENAILPFYGCTPLPPRRRAARAPFSIKLCICPFLRVARFPPFPPLCSAVIWHNRLSLNTLERLFPHDAFLTGEVRRKEFD